MTETKGQDMWKATTAPVEDRRRSQRVVIRLPVTVKVTLAGKPVTFAAHTVAVNSQGAMLAAPQTLAIDTQLEVTNERTREHAAARVTRTPPESREGFLIPVEFIEPAPGFWQISFPPKDWKPVD
ncbi:MAG: hypothetical protein ABSA32_14190 [Candidatus Acidiferrales bacterium]|jgi:hypothetical protein